MSISRHANLTHTGKGAPALGKADRVAAVARSPAALGEPIEAGSDYTTKFVFDLSADVASPKLHVHEGAWIARLSEMFLIGDEDSLFHKKTLFRLG